jgi:hypothetical protein
MGSVQRAIESIHSGSKSMQKVIEGNHKSSKLLLDAIKPLATMAIRHEKELEGLTK